MAYKVKPYVNQRSESTVDTALMLDLPESDVLEYKARFPGTMPVAATLCAFANGCGGDLVFGVSDDRTVVGVPEKDLVSLEESVANVCATMIRPIVIPRIRAVRHGERLVVVVRVDGGYQRPYLVGQEPANGHAYIRIGASTRKADSATIDALRLHGMGTSWDAYPSTAVGLREISREAIHEYLVRREERRGIPPPSSITESWMIKSKFAISSGGSVIPTNAAVLLFHPEPHQVYHGAAVDMARFAGMTAEAFIDKKLASGPIWKQYDQALSFFKSHIPVIADRTMAARIERLLYPQIAFREFMVNALCHRQYGGMSGTVKLAIFSDVIEITNPGTLPDGLEPRDLGVGISVLRNPVIARVFNELGLIEGWGTGIMIARKAIRDAGLLPASISQKGFFVQISSPWRFSSNTTAVDKAVYLAMADKGSITSAAVARIRSCSDRAARMWLEKQVRTGTMIKTGSTRNAAYQLI